MKRYTKVVDGVEMIKFPNEIILYTTKVVKDKNGNEKEVKMQTINPTLEMILEDGWVEYVAPTYTPTREEKLEKARNNKIEEILTYDSSDDVNVFFLGGHRMWIDKATRVGLKLRFESEIANGDVDTTLWYEGVPFEIPLGNAIQMLHMIEKYASKCYDNTQKHIGIVKSMEIIPEIDHYQYKEDYPEKLKFDM
jgi:hypothetical protein